MQISKARLKQIIMEEIQKFMVVEQDENLTPEEEKAASETLEAAAEASTTKAHLAESAFVEIGSDPDDVCAVTQIYTLLFVVSLT